MEVEKVWPPPLSLSKTLFYNNCDSHRLNVPKQCKIAPNSHWAIHLMLRTLAANDAAAHPPCLRTHRLSNNLWTGIRQGTLEIVIEEVLWSIRGSYQTTSINDKRDDFNFHITNFPFLSNNIPTSPANGVFISQLIRYARACSSYGCFTLRATRLSNKLLEQGYVKERLKSSLRKFYGRYGDLIKQYEVSLSQMLNDILWPDHIQWQTHTDQTLYQTRPFTEFWEVSIEHLRRVWHADRGRLLLRTPGLVPLGLAYVLLVETNPFSELVVIFPDYALRISLGTLSILLSLF